MMSASFDVPEDVVYKLVKATFDSYKDMVALHPACADITAKNAATIPVLYHPGALKYYKEIGLSVVSPTVKPGM